MNNKKNQIGSFRSRFSAGVSLCFTVLRNRFLAWHQAVVRLMTTDLWDVEITTLPALKQRLVRAVRIVTLVGKGFKEDECGLHASSLTFMTLLSIVPVLALGISVVRTVSYDSSMREKTKEFVRSLVIDIPSIGARATTNKVSEAAVVVDVTGAVATVNGNEVEGVLDDQTDEQMDKSPLVEVKPMTLSKIESLIDTGFDRVEQLNFGALGGIGLIFLIWAVITVLGDVEAAFNRVWGVVENRSLARKFADYLSVLIISPLLIFAASSLPIMGVIEAKMSEADSVFFLSAMAGVPVIKVIWMIFLLTLAFTFTLRFTPNTKVNLKPGLVGGFVAAVGFVVWLKICLSLQIGVAKYSTFFGSFATVPIILSWVFVSWEILLFGAEVSYAVQNVDSYRMEEGWRNASRKSKILLASALMREASASLARKNGLLDLHAFNHRHRVSARLVREVAHELARCGLIVETAADSDVYALRCNPDALTLGRLTALMIDFGIGPEGLGLMRLKTSSVVEQKLAEGLEQGLAIPIHTLPDNDDAGGE